MSLITSAVAQTGTLVFLIQQALGASRGAAHGFALALLTGLAAGVVALGAYQLLRLLLAMVVAGLRRDSGEPSSTPRRRA